MYKNGYALCELGGSICFLSHRIPVCRIKGFHFLLLLFIFTSCQLKHFYTSYDLFFFSIKLLDAPNRTIAL